MSFKYVLHLKGNNPTLTRILYVWFDYLGFPPPQGKPNWQALGGKFTLETRDFVIRYQQRWGIVPKPPRKYGEVTAREWQQLGLQVGYKAFDQRMYQCLYENGQCPPLQEYLDMVQGLGGYQGNALSSGINIYKPRFISMYAEEFGGVDSAVVNGLAAFLDYMRGDSNLMDVRHAAYVMATVHHETGGSWQPIDEKGGASKSYGKLVTVTCDGKQYTNRYYGRGYVQLTRTSDINNNGGIYYEISQKLNLGCELVANPDKAKEPETAYKILSNGMKDGWYIPNQYLSKYIHDNVCDYYNARNIVNTAHDEATLIESYAKTFEALLRVTTKWR